MILLCDEIKNCDNTEFYLYNYKTGRSRCGKEGPGVSRSDEHRTGGAGSAALGGGGGRVCRILAPKVIG